MVNETALSKRSIGMEIFETKSNEDITKIFSERGVDIPKEYANEVVEKVKKEFKNPVEINEDSLDVISGGASSWMKDNWGKVMSAIGAVVATGIAIGVAKHYVNKASQKIDSTNKNLQDWDKQIDNANGAIAEANSMVNELNERMRK